MDRVKDTGKAGVLDCSILYATPRVSLTHAAGLLEVSDRQIRRLVACGRLEQVGEGHHKRITSASLLRRLGMPLVLHSLSLTEK